MHTTYNGAVYCASRRLLAGLLALLLIASFYAGYTYGSQRSSRILRHYVMQLKNLQVAGDALSHSYEHVITIVELARIGANVSTTCSTITTNVSSINKSLKLIDGNCEFFAIAVLRSIDVASTHVRMIDLKSDEIRDKLNILNEKLSELKQLATKLEKTLMIEERPCFNPDTAEYIWEIYNEMKELYADIYGLLGEIRVFLEKKIGLYG